jgi:predicted transcriptional regulator
MTNKQLAIRAIRELPDDATWKDIAEEIAILESIRQGEDDIEAGRFITHEELKRQVKQWHSK